MSGPIDLHKIADALEAANELEAAAALRRIAVGENPSRALGLARRPGQRSLVTIAANETRNRLLREAAKKFFNGLSRPEQAEKLNGGWGHYRHSAWQREGSEDNCPSRRLGRPEEYYWRILKVRDSDPLEPATITRILSARGSDLS